VRSVSPPGRGPGSGRGARAAALTALLVASLVVVIPFVWLVCASLKPDAQFFGSLFLPLREGGGGVAWGELTLDHYGRLFRELDFGRGVLNSVLLSSVTAVLATLSSAMGGYALAKFRFRGRGLCTALVLGATLIPPPLLLAPGYQLVYHLGLLDTFAGLILPAAAPALGLFLFRQAILSSVPDEVLEAARIDGCGEGRMFFNVLLPLVRPMVGTFMMITFLGMWNNFVLPQVMLLTPAKFPLAVAVAQLRGVYYQDYGLQMAGTVVAIVPVAVLFLVLQREFVSGLTAGAVKG
jgi:multiple sugar transport system permease protein